MASLSSKLDAIAQSPRLSIVDRPGILDHLAGQDPASSAWLREILEDTVAGVFGVDPVQIRLPTRGRASVALARQVAMYIAHVGCRLTLTEVGELFRRDRTTVSHACSVVEQRRDDQSFDAAIHLLELVIQVIVGPRAGTAACGSPTSVFELTSAS